MKTFFFDTKDVDFMVYFFLIVNGRKTNIINNNVMNNIEFKFLSF